MNRKEKRLVLKLEVIKTKKAELVKILDMIGRINTWEKEELINMAGRIKELEVRLNFIRENKKGNNL